MNWGACAKALGAIQQTNNVSALKEQTHYNLYTSMIYHRNKEVMSPTPLLSAKYAPQKQIHKRTQITIGGNIIAYPGDYGTNTGSLEFVKLLFNSVCSRPNV